MPVTIKRDFLHVQTTFVEGWKTVDTPTKLIAAMVVVNNPWFGRGHVENLRPEIHENGPVIGKYLTQMLLDVAGDQIEGVGKASVVGMGGEVEHAQAMTHTLHFGNQFREAINAKSYLAFTNTRGAANTPIMIPLMHKDDGGMRSHYQTISTSIADAPAEDELVVALGVSIGGHPNHRIGNRYQDLKEMGHDVDNPAGV